LVVEIDNPATTVVMGFVPEVEQAFHHGGRDAALLKSGLRMMGHRKHDSSPYVVDGINATER
jgi:hypothetical protein